MSSPLTTHILDTARGTPARNVPVRLDALRDGEWVEIGSGRTNDDGRLPGLLPAGGLTRGVWRMHFDTDAYFRAQGIEGFYPYAEVVFRVTDPGSHHHVPLLLSPFGFSTYRGS